MTRRSFREILRKARRDLHEQLEVPALYIAHTGAAPVALTVRLHTQVVETGNQGASSKGYAEISEVTPRIVFMRDALEDARYGAIFSIAADEAYQVERTAPPNDISRTADVTVLSDEGRVGLPVPDATTHPEHFT